MTAYANDCKQILRIYIAHFHWPAISCSRDWDAEFSKNSKLKNDRYLSCFRKENNLPNVLTGYYCLKILMETFSVVASVPFNVNERRVALKLPDIVTGLPSNVR